MSLVENSSFFYVDAEELSSVDGTIEPLVIRKSIQRLTSDPDVVAHSVNGEFESGNPGSDVVASIQEFTVRHSIQPFTEVDRSLSGHTLPSPVYHYVGASIVPFNDHSQFNLNVDSETYHMANHITASLSGSVDYVPRDSVSMTCGFTFGTSTTPVGTDSIAFGGFIGESGHFYTS